MSTSLPRVDHNDCARAARTPSPECSQPDYEVALRITCATPQRGVTVYTVVGIVGPLTGLELRKYLLAGLPSAQSAVVVDLLDAHFVGVVGLHALKEALAWVEPWHCVRLVTANPGLSRLLRLYGLADTVDIFDRLDAALAPATPRRTAEALQ